MASFPQQLSYQVSPIILTGGTASQIPGGMLPMISLFAVDAGGGQPGLALGLPILGGTLDDAFGAFNVLPGGTLVSQSISKYPFANQEVAANAVIREPLTISVIMDSPMRGPNAWQVKNIVFTSLKGTLEQHNNRGGTYTVVTPAYHYDNLIMTSLTDNSRGNNSLPQNAWRFDFERPLTSLVDLQGAQNSFLTKITNQVPTGGQPTGPQPGTPVADVTMQETIKAAGGLTGRTPYPLTRAISAQVANYPALPNMANFPYGGIS